ncbi:nucleotide exchange factor GrpE [Kutzneria chonburiensis]|uniref:Protein GrpE n=1 Tax=Kutzneria chonburiensis TaxID=1483604 RepID=A0ABV6MQL7_9PSEU|nr:nucleotide exchange factor GrpE [Kutzneria chonburiensis]
MTNPEHAAADHAATAADVGAGADARPQEPVPTRQARIEDLEDRWRRAMAELDNTRKRHAVELRRATAAERARVAAAWLPVLDNLELALAHADADQGSVLQGVRSIRDQAVQLLAALGYPRDDETGVPFDPSRHEVVAVVNDPETEPNTVVGVVRPGYGGSGHELRPAAVTVAGTRE